MADHRLPPDHQPLPSSPGAAPRIGVWAVGEDQAIRRRARALAAELGCPIVAGDATNCELLLVVALDGLELRAAGRGAPRGIRVDWCAGGAARHRLATASRRQPLARAVGLKKGPRAVIDATTGLGRDALWLATLGCPVVAIERSPVLGVMLRDAWERLEPGPVRQRLRLRIGDAADVLTALAPRERPAVVYLDPMFPPRGKTAKPKKEMCILRRLVGDDADASTLVAVARRVARERVVVKRTPRAPPLAPDPSLTIRSKLVRFDVYLTS